MGRYVAYSLVLLLLYSFGCARAVYAQSEPFYKGKTISIVVGYNPGDAHDLWRVPTPATWGDISRGIPIFSCATCPAAER